MPALFNDFGELDQKILFHIEGSMKVRCSYFWFYAKIKPTLFHNLYMNPDEAFLGDDCPVTHISPDAHYEFFYYSNKCGIVTKTFQETLLLQTKIKYISSNSGDMAEMPVSCVVTKQACMYPSSNETESEDDETSSEDTEVAYVLQSHESKPFHVTVSVRPCAYRNQYIFADELYLGSGCPMTPIQTYMYDFIYPVYECGIRIRRAVSEEVLLFQTELYFNPRNIRYGPQKIPLECSASSASEIELAEVSLQESVLLEKPAPTAPRQTWLTVLKRELEFLGVTQILIGLIYLYFGIIVSSKINDSEFTEYFFSSFKAGYPFWGALFFAISGILSIMSERKPSAYLIRGCLGANAVSSVAAGTGVGVLISNLKQSSTYVYRCKEVYENDYCSLACFSTEVVAIILLLTILGFGSAVSLIAYGIGEIIEGNQIPEDRLYEEVNIYSPIYRCVHSAIKSSHSGDSISCTVDKRFDATNRATGKCFRKPIPVVTEEPHLERTRIL
ncbi:hypothetical protein MJG53_010757 [Ovis ammon polii x Ovis aries]|uniref:Uncharacterized protein n=1 Tax=Ovis ammon polii x Ovis aries TaxID=2918886 RepID=A0ACB9UVB3_9CETA|nr:hypothetical protein MJG53_010757 [Ovis ammon polii x Ovis aries]